MKQGMKKLLSALLALGLLAGLLPVTAQAAAVYDVWVGGVRVDSSNASDVLGDGTVVFTPASGSEYARLTLNNADITGAPVPTWPDDNDGIYSLDDLTLEIHGTNFVTAADAAAGGDSLGIYVEDQNLVIEGDGTLNVTAGAGVYSCAINTFTMTVRSGSIRAAAGKASDESEAIYSDNFTMEGGTLIAMGGEAPLSWGVGGNAAIRGGAVSAMGQARAFYRKPDLSGYADPDVKVSAAASESAAAVWNGTDALGGDDSSFKYVYIGEILNGYDVWIGATRVTADNKDDVLGDGGKAKYDPDTRTLTLNDLTLTADRGHGTMGGEGLIVANENLNITGSAVLIGMGTELYEGVFTGGALAFDNADITVVNTPVGFSSLGPCTIENSKITARSGITDGGLWSGELTVKSSTVAVRAENGYGISSDVAAISGADTVVKADGKNGAIHTSTAGISIASPLMIREPDGGAISADGSSIVESDGTTPATHAVIKDPVTSPEYNIVFPAGKAYDGPGAIHQEITKAAPGDEVYLRFGDVSVEDGKYLAGFTSKQAGQLRYTEMTEEDVVVLHFTMPAEDVYIEPLIEEQMTLTVNLTGGSKTFSPNLYTLLNNALYSARVQGLVDLNGEYVPAVGDMVTVADLDRDGYYDIINDIENGFSIHDDCQLTGEYTVSGIKQGAYSAITFRFSKVDYKIWVGGVQVDSENAGDVLGDGGSVKYDSDSNTLTLNNANITGALLPYSSTSTAGIYTQTDLTLEIVGSSSITGTDASDISAGIVLDPYDLTVTGSGTLDVSAGSAEYSFGIFATYKITMHSGTVRATAGKASKNSEAVFSNDFTMEGGTLIAKGGEAPKSWGISGDATIKGGTVTAIGQKCAFSERPDLSGYADSAATVNTEPSEIGAYAWNGTYALGGNDCSFKYVKIARYNPFTDVAEGTFYYDAVLWAVGREPQITNGTSPTTFSPNAVCTRGQVVTFLWRAAGAPEPAIALNPFADVKEGAFYYKAVLWAVQNGITKGVDATHFGPDQGCTRGQVVTFLHRAQGTPTPGSSVNPFGDVAAGAFYYDAVLWAVEKGVTNGTSPTTFAPNNTCTRGQIVTFLYRAQA